MGFSNKCPVNTWISSWLMPLNYNSNNNSNNKLSVLRTTVRIILSGENSKGPSIKYVRKIFRKSNISNPLIRTCTYQGVINVSFSENFAYVLNGWSLKYTVKLLSNYPFCLKKMVWNKKKQIEARRKVQLAVNWMSE